jgi:hypothetical protein
MSAKAAAQSTVEPDSAFDSLDLEGRVERNPYGMVAGALGIGFVLGGGLFTRLTAGVLSAGLRIVLMAALPMLQEELIQAVTAPRSETNTENDQ